MSEHRTPRRLGRPPIDTMAEGERRACILLTARDLFGRRGYAGVSLGDIAAEVGVTKAALYHHFPSKDELYTEMLCQLLAQIAGRIRDVAALPEPVPVRLHRLAENYILHVPPDANLDAMLRDAEEHLTPAQRARIMVDARRSIEAAIEDLMREGIDRGELRGDDPRLLTHAFRQMLLGFGGRRGAEAGFQGRPAVAEAVIDLFFHGALPAASRPDR